MRGGIGFLGAGLGSSGMGVSLRKPSSDRVRHFACSTGLAMSLLTGAASPNEAQAQSRYPMEASSLPRFTLREILSGRNDSLFHIPGEWVRAATAARPESLAFLTYVSAAARSGIVPLDGATLPAQRYQHVMGLYRRAELRGATRRTLESIRSAIPSDSTRARFDSIFHPRGEWFLDLHDAAIAWARVRAPHFSLDSVRQALFAAGLLPRNDSSFAAESVARALYGLTVLAANDSAGFAIVRDDLHRGGAGPAAAVLFLLDGYLESQRWFAAALRFFLIEPWAPAGRAGFSLGDFVRQEWQQVQAAPPGSETPTPEIRIRLFGYPQAVPHYGVPPVLFDRLVRSENQSANQWLASHGRSALLHALRWLPSGDTTLALLQVGGQTVRL